MLSSRAGIFSYPKFDYGRICSVQYTEAEAVSSSMAGATAQEEVDEPSLSLPITGFQSSPAPACPTKASASRL
jgi:hypothetical protein